MNTATLREKILEVDPTATFQSTEGLTFVDTLDNPELSAFIRSIAPDETVALDTEDEMLGYLYGRIDIAEMNQKWSDVLEANLVIIGSGPNGDPLVIDLTVSPLGSSIGFLSHDQLWESSPPTPRAVYAQLPDPLLTFITKLRTEEEYPCDYYGARDYSSEV